MGDTELRMNLVDNYLKRFHDFQKIEWRFNKGKATLQDCWKMFKSIETLPHMYSTLMKAEGDHAHLVQEMFTHPIETLISDFGNFQAMIEATVDKEAVATYQIFIVKSSYDPELALLKERLNDIEHKLERLSDKTSKIMDLPNVKLENNPLNGYYFRIPRKVCGEGK